MENCFLICYPELSDNEKLFVDHMCKVWTEWRDKYESEIKRLHKEIEWYQKQIDKMKVKGEQNENN